MLLTTIALRLLKITGEAGMARSQLRGMTPKGIRSSSEKATEMFKYNTAMQDTRSTLKHS
eukprot:7030854-Pyramimonas_sp.AAC.1